MKWIRLIAPWILLAAYLPLVVQSSLHVHHDTVDVHDACQQCVGHFESQHHHQSDCQYCHFLGLNYLRPSSGQTTVLLPATDECTVENAEIVQMLRYGTSLLRAPPVHPFLHSAKA